MENSFPRAQLLVSVVFQHLDVVYPCKSLWMSAVFAACLNLHIYSAGVQCVFSFFLLSDTLCPPGQFYEDCGNRVDGPSASKGLACEQTCESYLLNLTCSAHEPCVPGCACPSGWVESLLSAILVSVITYKNILWWTIFIYQWQLELCNIY